MSSTFQSLLKNNAEKFKSSQMLHCELVNSYWYIRELSDPEDGGTKLIQNISNHITANMGNIPAYLYVHQLHWDKLTSHKVGMAWSHTTTNSAYLPSIGLLPFPNICHLVSWNGLLFISTEKSSNFTVLETELLVIFIHFYLLYFFKPMDIKITMNDRKVVPFSWGSVVSLVIYCTVFYCIVCTIL